MADLADSGMVLPADLAGGVIVGVAALAAAGTVTLRVADLDVSGLVFIGVTDLADAGMVFPADLAGRSP